MADPFQPEIVMPRGIATRHFGRVTLEGPGLAGEKLERHGADHFRVVLASAAGQSVHSLEPPKGLQSSSSSHRYRENR